MANTQSKKQIQENEKIKKQVQEIRDIAKQFAGSMEMVNALSATSAVNFQKILDLGKENTAQSKKEIKFRTDSSDLTKEILENAQNIGTEEFKSLDVSTKIAKARRMGAKALVQELKLAKSMNQIQKQQHKQIMATADLAAKPFEAIDSFIKQIPIVGDLLSAVVGSGEWAEKMRTSILESGRAGLDGVFSGKKLSAKQIAAGFGGAEAKKHFEDTGKVMKESLVNRFKKLSPAVKGTVGGIALIASLSAMAAMKMAAFANEAGLSYKQVLTMAGPLLVNAEAVKAFADEMGTANNLTTSQAFGLKVLEKQFGLSAQAAAKMFANTRGITGQTMDQFISQQKITGEMARTAGVLPNKVFEDMAANTQVLAEFSDATGDNMRRAAIEAAKFGLSIADSAKAADSLLDFETSIEKQMEASVLLGKQLNFDKARELALSGDLEGQQKAIQKEVRAIGDLSKLNVIQRRALADAAGMEFTALQKMANPQIAAADAAEKQKNMLIGSIAAGAAVVGTFLAGVMAFKAVGTKGKSLVADTGNAVKGALAGGAVGATIGAAGGAIFNTAKNALMDTDMPKLAKGGVIVGEAGPEVVAPLPSAGVNVDMIETNRLLKRLITINESGTIKLSDKLGDLKLS